MDCGRLYANLCTFCHFVATNIDYIGEDSLNEDYVPVPSFATAFSDAVSSALKKQGVGSSLPNPKCKGRNKKGKTLLFTTSNGPKYS